MKDSIADGVKVVKLPKASERKIAKFGKDITLLFSKVEGFFKPVDTIEAAQAMLDAERLVIYAVFRTPENKFVLGMLRGDEMPPDEAARIIYEICRYRMVAWGDPLWHIWQDYEGVGDAK